MKRYGFNLVLVLFIILGIVSCQTATPESEPVNYYKVSFDKNDMEASGTMADQQIAEGKEKNLSACTFQKTGWTFAGWAESSDGVVLYSDQQSYAMGSADVVLYAKWIQNPLYEIVFDKNDVLAVGSMDNQAITSGLSAPLNSCQFSKEGWSFSGWAITQTGAVAYMDNGDFLMGNGQVTLYAKWTPNNYTISFDRNDAGAVGTMTAQTMASGSSNNLKSCSFTKSGWTFAGWALTSSGEIAYSNQYNYTMGTANITLYAKWTAPATYAIRDRGPAGGWIFYDKGVYFEGWRYLEAAIYDSAANSSIVWGTDGYEGFDVPGANGTAVGTGLQNSLDIVNGDPAANNTSAKLCLDKSMSNGGVNYADWFLPSKDELNLMFVNLKSAGVGNFVNSDYWSSSEIDKYTAWGQGFGSGTAYAGGKHLSESVRCVRAF